MKRHNGMRPQDIVVLMKILSLKESNWTYADIAKAIHISSSEVFEAMERCRLAKLVDESKKTIYRLALKEFLVSGLKYVFPVEPGPIVRGIPTAHSAPPISEKIVAGNEVFVWEYKKGDIRGQSIEPLYKTVPEVVNSDKELYELLVIIDTIRVGRAREISIAIEELNKRLDGIK
jgi:hypothetical protein